MACCSFDETVDRRFNAKKARTAERRDRLAVRMDRGGEAFMERVTSKLPRTPPNSARIVEAGTNRCAVR